MSQQPSLAKLQTSQAFEARHLDLNEASMNAMLASVNAQSLDDLTNQIVPASILKAPFLDIEAKSEQQALAEIRALADQNDVFKSYIGQGYHGTLVPNVILRNVLENPGWYTAYTPYQPEIAQGRLEALLNYQQMVNDLTGMELANASLLDEATAAGEAMSMAKRAMRRNKSKTFFVESGVYPQTLDVIKTRAEFFGWNVVVDDADNLDQHDVFGALLQYPRQDGEVVDYTDVIEKLHAKKAMACVASDLMALVNLKTPGDMGADVVLGNSQRFGVPMGFGGPHAAFFATKDEYKRSVPGRIIGVSIDSKGKTALRMALQTREQHIRREKANSNICTAQVLLANMASFYAVYHGPQGLKSIATRIQWMTSIVAKALQNAGVEISNTTWFDTLTFTSNDVELESRAIAAKLNLRIDGLVDGKSTYGVSLNEAVTTADLAELIEVITGKPADIDALEAQSALGGEGFALQRTTEFLTHPVFNSHHTEHEMLRYMKKLENRDLAMNQSMITLGSCTMKLNATAQMIPVTWPEFANMHPFAPRTQTKGYTALIESLEGFLKQITGFDAICMQPNSGAQGEYAGLLAIQKYHQSRGEGHRNVCLIPQSAHGTNPASAQMVSLKVVVVKCDEQGNIDQADLKEKAEEHAEKLSCLMMTYPSTHGVYEAGANEVCDTIHANGGQVYMDGANLNAQVGVTSPASIGADVTHMNLHKTFAIPHGGGGPGMGPIGVAKHLAPFIANHAVSPIENESKGQGAVSAAPFGSAAILPISWMYIRLLGSQGLRKSTQMALLNANYMAKRLSEKFDILYSGQNGRVAHECIIDLRPIKAACGVSEVDFAKRLIDYGFHAPTMSFPVAGTFMIEPTESESKGEIDRFVDALLSIRDEATAIEKGEVELEQSPLVHAPHTQNDLMGSDQEWNKPYSREVAAFPAAHVKANKFWPFVNRIDDVYGDRNLICSCPPIESYED
jgi:glycine dehydrogenase